ncbi:pleckstrin homology domain-containing family G member 5-like isoform X2 [Orbicella faveolata]|uniref:pleckstrin homology domain-containing family G member 5-like isoform X2 n=1 Tax=Orbicella faveolata TaxID=48498 RepID=UPI0009E2F7CB|nr:pleckstrin homology domain-containing family G member 5-like isoform X2 [Orbicella faveolata]
MRRGFCYFTKTSHGIYQTEVQFNSILPLQRRQYWMCFLEILLLRRILRGRDDFDHYEKERRVCQGKLCSSNVQTEKQNAVKVCHHEDCQEANHGHPLLLCLRCDEVHHLGSGSNHARFDVPERPSTNLIRTPSSHSAGSDSGNEDDLESEPKV